jgi:hypothetical protein
MKLKWPETGWDQLVDRLRGSVFYHPLKYKLFNYQQLDSRVLEVRLKEFDGCYQTLDVRTGITKLIIFDQNDEWFEMEDLLWFLNHPSYWPHLKEIEIREFKFPPLEGKIKMVFDNTWGLPEKLFHMLQLCSQSNPKMAGSPMWASRDKELLDYVAKMSQIGIGKFTWKMYLNRREKDESYETYKNRLLAKAPLVETETLDLNLPWGAAMVNLEKQIPCIILLSCPGLPERGDLERLQFLSPNVLCLVIETKLVLKVARLDFLEHTQLILREPSDLRESGEVEVDLISSKLERWKWFTKGGRNGGNGDLVPSNKKIKVRDG